MPARLMEHAVDPRADLWDKLGDIDDLEVFANQVLVAIYVRPERTKSGIILTDANRDEDKSQGKIGLVVKLGEYAFTVDPTKRDEWFGSINAENEGGTIKLGDWVYFRASDGWAVTVNQQPCRILDDVRIRGRVKHPDMVW